MLILLVKKNKNDEKSINSIWKKLEIDYTTKSILNDLMQKYHIWRLTLFIFKNRNNNNPNNEIYSIALNYIIKFKLYLLIN